MNKEDFWNLIDETNRLCPTRDKESIMAVVTEKLMKLDVNDILDFHMIQQEYFRMAYRNDLHAASEAIGAIIRWLAGFYILAYISRQRGVHRRDEQS